MKEYFGTIGAFLAIVLTVSVGPDSWLLNRIDAVANIAQVNSIGVENAKAQNSELEAQHNQDTLARYRESTNNTLLIEEYIQNLDTKITIARLEDNITDLTRAIADEQAELDRLDRIINGGSAAGPSTETWRARDRSQGLLAGYTTQLESKVRELNRLMLP